MNITVAGCGYIGLSNALLLSQNHKVMVLDVVTEKVAILNCSKSPIIETENFVVCYKLPGIF